MTTPASRARAAKRVALFRARREAWLDEQRRALTPRARADEAPGGRDARFAELDRLLADEARYGRQRAAGAGGSDDADESEAAE